MKHIISLLLLFGCVVAEGNSSGTHNISFTITEVTWMRVDVSTNGKRIALDL